MLRNRVYRGLIVHKGAAFPGEHPAIIDEELWRRVQGRLDENTLDRRAGDKANEPNLLTGILFDARSEIMTPTHAVKKGTRYRYYVSRRLITGTVADASEQQLHGQRIPAPNLEALIENRMRSFFADPVEVLNAIAEGHHDTPSQKRITNAASALSARWDRMPIDARYEWIRSLIVRAQVHAERIDIEVNSMRLAKLLISDGASPELLTTAARHCDDIERLVTLCIPARLKRTGKEMKFIVTGVANASPADTSLIRLLVRARKISSQLLAAHRPTLDDIAERENITPSYASRLVRLAFLAPDIATSILDGKQPAELTANKLMADTRLPLDWRDQRKGLGFA
jgi:hypothetical protein